MDKRIPKILHIGAYFALLALPVVLVLLYISTNSVLLITRAIQILLSILFGASFSYVCIYAYVTKFFRDSVLSYVGTKLLLAFVIFACILGTITLYGPMGIFRTWLITTAMDTMEHQYLCKWFYSDEQIAKVYADNYTVYLDSDVDPSLINTKNTNKKKVLEDLRSTINSSEGMLLEKDEYALILEKVNGQNAYVAIIFDPSKVVLGYSKYISSGRGQFVTNMAEDAGAVLAINAAGFYDEGGTSSGGRPVGLTIADGKVISKDTETNIGTEYAKKGGLIGFNANNVLILAKDVDATSAEKMGIRDAVSWGPFLVVNGESLFVKGNGGYSCSSRSAIGQRADGAVIFITVNSSNTRMRGASMQDLADLMIKYGAVNAANLDGGTSTGMVAPSADAKIASSKASPCNSTSNYWFINYPTNASMEHKTRIVADCWMVMP